MGKSFFTHFIRQFVAVSLVVCLIWTSGDFVQAAQGLPSRPVQFELAPPESLGQVTGYFNSTSPNAKRVILLQDLHAHYGVQKNIAGILEFLATRPSSSAIPPVRLRRMTSLPIETGREAAVSGGSKNGFRLTTAGKTKGVKALPFALAVEGASGPVDHSVMALFPDKKVREMAADYLMREGELSGAEYFAIARGLPAALTGVEDESYYELHRELFRKTFQKRQRLVGLIKGIQSDLASLEAKGFSKDLQKFQRKLDAFNNGHIGTAEAVAWLTAEAQPLGMDVSALNSKTNEHLFADIESLAFILSLQKANTPLERNLLQARHDLALLLKVTDLRATEADVRTFGPRLNPFVALLQSLLASRGMQKFDVEEARELISSSIDYYAIAMMRNEPMAVNTLALIGQRDLKPQTANLKDKKTPKTLRFEVRDQPGVAVLIAGGFHTAPITHILRQKNVSYVVITPTVDELSDAQHELYVKRLSGDLLTVPEILANAKPFNNTSGHSGLLAKIKWIKFQKDGLAIGKAVKPVMEVAAIVGVLAYIAGVTDGGAHLTSLTAPYISWIYQIPVMDALAQFREIFSQPVVAAAAGAGTAKIVAGAAAGKLTGATGLAAVPFLGSFANTLPNNRLGPGQAPLHGRTDIRGGVLRQKVNNRIPAKQRIPPKSTPNYYHDHDKRAVEKVFGERLGRLPTQEEWTRILDSAWADNKTAQQAAEDAVRPLETSYAKMVEEARSHNVIFVINREITPRTLEAAKAALEAIRDMKDLLNKAAAPIIFEIAKIEDEGELGNADISATVGPAKMGVSQHLDQFGGNKRDLAAQRRMTTTHELMHKLSTVMDKNGKDLVFPVADWIALLELHGYTFHVEGRTLSPRDHLRGRLNEVKEKIRLLASEDFTHLEWVLEGEEGQYVANPHELMAWHAVRHEQRSYFGNPWVADESTLAILQRGLLRANNQKYQYDSERGVWKRSGTEDVRYLNGGLNPFDFLASLAHRLSGRPFSAYYESAQKWSLVFSDIWNRLRGRRQPVKGDLTPKIENASRESKFRVGDTVSAPPTLNESTVIKVHRVDLHRLPVGTLVYYEIANSKWTYTLRVEPAGRVSIWLRQDSGYIEAPINGVGTLSESKDILGTLEEGKETYMPYFHQTPFGEGPRQLVSVGLEGFNSPPENIQIELPQGASLPPEAVKIISSAELDRREEVDQRENFISSGMLLFIKYFENKTTASHRRVIDLLLKDLRGQAEQQGLTSIQIDELVEFIEDKARELAETERPVPEFRKQLTRWLERLSPGRPGLADADNLAIKKETSDPSREPSGPESVQNARLEQARAHALRLVAKDMKREPSTFLHVINQMRRKMAEEMGITPKEITLEEAQALIKSTPVRASDRDQRYAYVTKATHAPEIRFNTAYAASLSDQALLWVTLHELGHVFFQFGNIPHGDWRLGKRFNSDLDIFFSPVSDLAGRIKKSTLLEWLRSRYTPEQKRRLAHEVSERFQFEEDQADQVALVLMWAGQSGDRPSLKFLDEALGACNLFNFERDERQGLDTFLEEIGVETHPSSDRRGRITGWMRGPMIDFDSHRVLNREIEKFRTNGQVGSLPYVERLRTAGLIALAGEFSLVLKLALGRLSVDLYGDDTTMELAPGITTHAGIGTGAIHLVRGEFLKLKAQGPRAVAGRLAHESKEIVRWREEARVRGETAATIRDWIKKNLSDARVLDRQIHREGLDLERRISGNNSVGTYDTPEYPFDIIIQAHTGQHSNSPEDHPIYIDERAPAISRRTLLGLGISAAAAHFLSVRVSAQSNQAASLPFSKKLIDVIGRALLIDAAQGLSLFHELSFWEKKDLTPEEAKDALMIFEYFWDTTNRRLRDIKASGLSDERMGMALVLRMNGDLLNLAVQGDPSRGLESFMTQGIRLLQLDLDFWAEGPIKPKDLLMGDLLRSTLNKVPEAASVQRTWGNLLTWLGPNQFTGLLNTPDHAPLEEFIAAAFQSGYVIYISDKGFAGNASAHSAEFDVYRWEKESPVETHQLGDVRSVVVPVTALFESRPVLARPIYMKAYRPMIAKVLNGNAVLAQYYANVRDGRPVNLAYKRANADSLSILQRLLRHVFPQGGVGNIQRLLDLATILHELTHLWDYPMRIRLRVPNFHFGLSDEEWRAFEKQTGVDDSHYPGRIPVELTAYLGQLAFSEKPLFTFLELTGRLSASRDTVESITFDSLVRSVVGQMIPITQGRAQLLARELFEQRTPATPITLARWLDALMDSNADFDVLGEQIRAAARAAYSDTFVTPAGEPAQLPLKEQVTALRSAGSAAGQLAQAKPAPLDRRTALSRLFKPINAAVAGSVSLPAPSEATARRINRAQQAGTNKSEPRYMTAWEMFRLGELGLAKAIWLVKSNFTSIKHFMDYVPSMEGLLRQFGQTQGLSNLQINIEMDQAMPWGQASSVTTTYAEGRLSGLHFRVNPHLDPETMKAAVLFEMSRVVLEAGLQNPVQRRSPMESLITFLFKLIGISEQTRLAARAMRQFLDTTRPNLLREGLDTAIQASRAERAGGRLMADNSAAMRFLLTHLPILSRPEAVRRNLAAHRRGFIATQA